jgi:hypothetical protein
VRFLLVILAGLLIAQGGFAQEEEFGPAPGAGAGRGGGRGGRGGPVEPPPPPKPGFECFDRAEAPEFPRAALQQHVDGTVWVTLDVTAQGTPDKIRTRVTSAWAAGEKLLAPPVEKAVRDSKFKSSCAGKSVAVVYRYDLVGYPVAAPEVTTKSDARIMYINSSPELTPAKGRNAAAAK